jgi:hypothetical protein
MAEALRRVQLLIEPRQHAALARRAEIEGTSVAEVTRRVIDFGLQEVAARDRLAGRARALERAQQLRKEQLDRRRGRALEVDVADSIERMREERDAGTTAGRR